jgi:hypothetical protein
MVLIKHRDRFSFLSFCSILQLPVNHALFLIPKYSLHHSIEDSSLRCTYVPEKTAASIIATNDGDNGLFETSVYIYQTTLCHNPEDLY